MQNYRNTVQTQGSSELFQDVGYGLHELVSRANSLTEHVFFEVVGTIAALEFAKDLSQYSTPLGIVVVACLMGLEVVFDIYGKKNLVMLIVLRSIVSFSRAFVGTLFAHEIVHSVHVSTVTTSIVFMALAVVCLTLSMTILNTGAFRTEMYS